MEIIIKKGFFPARKIIEGWTKMSRKFIQTLDLKILKAQLDKALSKLGLTEPTLNMSWEGIWYLIKI